MLCCSLVLPAKSASQGFLSAGKRHDILEVGRVPSATSVDINPVQTVWGSSIQEGNVEALLEERGDGRKHGTALARLVVCDSEKKGGHPGVELCGQDSHKLDVGCC